MASQLLQPEGTITFRYTMPAPIEQWPAESTTLLETPPGSPTVARLELDPRLEMTFLRAPCGGQTRVAKVSLTPLRGSLVLQIYLIWSPDEVRLHVGRIDQPGRLLGSDEA
jgi:hypothetical protein